MNQQVSAIYLELLVNDQLVDRVALPAFSSSRLFSAQVKHCMQELLKKHEGFLLKNNAGPVFFLSGVSSSMNSFVPLGGGLGS